VSNENVAASAPVHRLVGRALDVLVAVHVMGWTDEPEFGLMNGEQFMEIDGPFCPSSNIKDAWRVVEHITTPCAGRVDGVPWSTRFAHLFREADLWACNHEEAAMDICLLAIRAAGIVFPPNATDHRDEAIDAEAYQPNSTMGSHPPVPPGA
jgi:hypothetical protein